jgi:hypothetical protein
MKLIAIVASAVVASASGGVASGCVLPTSDLKPTPVAAADLLTKLDAGQVARLEIYVSPRSAVAVDRTGRKFAAVETSDSELALLRHARQAETPVLVHLSAADLATRLPGAVVSRSS